MKRDFRLHVTAAGREYVRPLGRSSLEAAGVAAQSIALYAPKPVTVRVQRGPEWTDVGTISSSFHPT